MCSFLCTTLNNTSTHSVMNVTFCAQLVYHAVYYAKWMVRKPNTMKHKFNVYTLYKSHSFVLFYYITCQRLDLNICFQHVLTLLLKDTHLIQKVNIRQPAHKSRHVLVWIWFLIIRCCALYNYCVIVLFIIVLCILDHLL